jgi:thiamine biosynthesis lipoprotein
MNTDVAAWLWHADPGVAQEALHEVKRAFGEGHARFSRFEATSELSALNAASGRPFAASPELFEVVAQALEFSRLTGGLFNPAIIGALEAAGYDRTFEMVNQRGGHGAISLGPVPRPRVALDAERRTIMLPAGARLDLGGIAKGWTVQRAAQRLSGYGPCLVDAGGDMLTIGAPPGESGWSIGVADPFDPRRDVAHLKVRDAGVATSGIDRRRWLRDGALQHHLIDPRTGLPSDSDLMSVTIIAPTAVEAEIYAKATFLLGASEGLAYVEARPALSALCVMRDGAALASSRLEDHLDVRFVYDASEILAA